MPCHTIPYHTIPWHALIPFPTRRKSLALLSLTKLILIVITIPVLLAQGEDGLTIQTLPW